MARELVYLRIHSKGWAVETPGEQRGGATEEKTALGNVRHLSNPDSVQVTSQERQESTRSIALHHTVEQGVSRALWPRDQPLSPSFCLVPDASPLLLL